MADTNDITDHEDGVRIVQQALNEYGDCQVVVNNAGICRDRTFASMIPNLYQSALRGFNADKSR